MFAIKEILRGKCLLISSTIIIFLFIFISNVMSSAYTKKEEVYRVIISNILYDETYYKEFKEKYGDQFYKLEKVKAPLKEK
jgi:TM2 domain-containing membrane protein YozV